jgi:CheY-like chemotaxis protein
MGKAAPSLKGVVIGVGNRILIVDDDAVNREIFRWSLEGLCEIDELTSGVGAAARIAEVDYDLVLLDVMMPIVGGVEVVEDVNRLRADLLPRILVVTAAMNQRLLEQLSVFPLAGVIERPYDPEQISEICAPFFTRQ